jgi:hypothetical protein
MPPAWITSPLAARLRAAQERDRTLRFVGRALRDDARARPRDVEASLAVVDTAPPRRRENWRPAADARSEPADSNGCDGCTRVGAK